MFETISAREKTFREQRIVLGLLFRPADRSMFRGVLC